MTRPPSCFIMIPVTPWTKIRGRKTTTVVSVEAITACPTSSAPNIEASRRPVPRDICEMMFSSTTTALSTTMPMAIASAERLMMLIVQPIRNMKTNAMISEKGMESAMTSEVRKLRRKKRVVRITKSPP